MPKVKSEGARSGDKISFNLTVKLTTGMVLSTTLNGPPGEMVLGNGEAVAGLEKAIRGMTPGQKKTVTVQSQNAFGARNEDLLVPIPRARFGDVELSLGQVINLPGQNNESISAKIRIIDEYMVVVDLNHPLAGHDLVYDIELISIIARGVPIKAARTGKVR